MFDLLFIKVNIIKSKKENTVDYIYKSNKVNFLFWNQNGLRNIRRIVIFRYFISSFFFQSRLSVNAVTAGDYGLPLRIARFIGELDSGFRLLNLKNDSLRKRFDGLKYDLKKAEEVVYDLTIRGLKPDGAQSGGAQASMEAT